jgi:cyclopropane fatty-acyl-phospholipid synthase-like methyltransferase
MERDPATSYDTLPYHGNFIPMTHPDRMATMAVLHGINPPPVERCRVLELGCTDGGNLLSMAETLPNASFLGVDLSPRQIAEGRAAMEALGVGNVELLTMNLTKVDDSFGLFDYIICHGVYSWVTASVRDKILEICSRNLAPDGVAYVSYNTYPGWHLRRILREMMLYHTQGITDPTGRVHQARALLEFVTRFALPQDGPYSCGLREESRKFEKYQGTYIFHEFLAEENHPVYFHEFVVHAASAGLRYLSHATFGLEESGLSPEFLQDISQLGPDIIRREQYIDFVLNRSFRQSLLCHAGRMTAGGPRPEAVRSLRLVAMARPENPTPDLRSDAREPFRTVHGSKFMIDEPLLKSALFALHRLWPRSTSLEQLWAMSRELVGESKVTTETDCEELATKLLQCHMMQLVDLHTCATRRSPPSPACNPSPPPWHGGTPSTARGSSASAVTSLCSRRSTA